MPTFFQLHYRGRQYKFAGENAAMGIINATPDSFSDGGRNLPVENALETARQMIESGAAFLDIGGESTRPGFTPVSAEEELQRVLPVIHGIREFSDIPISIDTSKAEVACGALEAGADIVNDVSALGDSAMAGVIARYDAGCILMHCATLPPDTPAPADDVAEWLVNRLEFALRETGLSREHFAVDPGIGFGKTHPQEKEILDHLEKIREACARTLLLGISRKSFVGWLFNEPDTLKRDNATMQLARQYRNAYDIFRVHNVDAFLKS